MADPPKTGPGRPDQRVRASRVKTAKAQVKARILFSSGTGSQHATDSRENVGGRTVDQFRRLRDKH
jgi:hypothetical protein